MRLTCLRRRHTPSIALFCTVRVVAPRCPSSITRTPGRTAERTGGGVPTTRTTAQTCVARMFPFQGRESSFAPTCLHRRGRSALLLRRTRLPIPCGNASVSDEWNSRPRLESARRVHSQAAGSAVVAGWSSHLVFHPVPSHGPQCFCFVCDVNASECKEWGDGACLPQSRAPFALLDPSKNVFRRECSDGSVSFFVLCACAHRPLSCFQTVESQLSTSSAILPEPRA